MDPMERGRWELFSCPDMFSSPNRALVPNRPELESCLLWLAICYLFGVFFFQVCSAYSSVYRLPWLRHRWAQKTGLRHAELENSAVLRTTQAVGNVPAQVKVILMACRVSSHSFSSTRPHWDPSEWCQEQQQFLNGKSLLSGPRFPHQSNGGKNESNNVTQLLPKISVLLCFTL